MTELNNLIQTRNHLAITEINNKDIDEYKCVAFIKMGMYKESLAFCKPNSYEMVYAMYKLRKYNECLKILKRVINVNEAKFRVLKSQILYNLGRYTEAYNSLKSVILDDEVVINLAAMKSLAVSAQNQTKVKSVSVTSCKTTAVEFKEFLDYKFRKPVLEEEFRYNESFEFLSGDYKEHLNKLVKKYPNGYIKRQLDLLNKDYNEVGNMELSANENEVLGFNMKDIKCFSNPMHFQFNFVNISSSRYLPVNEYICYKKMQEINYEGGEYKIPSNTNNLRLLNAIINVRKMLDSQTYTRKYSYNNIDSLEWKVIEVLFMKKRVFIENISAVFDLLRAF